MERIKNVRIQEIMGLKLKPDIIDIIEKKILTSMATSKGCQRRKPKLLME
jgi:hypothetical protein